MSGVTTGQPIAVAVDGSPASMVATDWAARDAAMRHVALTLVHVVNEPTIGMWPEPALLNGFSEWRAKHGHQILTDARSVADRAIIDFDPITVNEMSCAGASIPTLVDLSKDVAMMVVGSRGNGALTRRLLGSVSSGLVQHAHCPVAVIHDEDPSSIIRRRRRSWSASTARRPRNSRFPWPSTKHPDVASA